MHRLLVRSPLCRSFGSFRATPSQALRIATQPKFIKSQFLSKRHMLTATATATHDPHHVCGKPSEEELANMTPEQRAAHEQFKATLSKMKEMMESPGFEAEQEAYERSPQAKKDLEEFINSPEGIETDEIFRRYFNSSKGAQLKAKALEEFDPEKLMTRIRAEGPTLAWDLLHDNKPLTTEQREAFSDFFSARDIDVFQPLSVELEKNDEAIKLYLKLKNSKSYFSLHQACEEVLGTPISQQQFERYLSLIGDPFIHEEYEHSSRWLKFSQLASVIILMILLYVLLFHPEEGEREIEYPFMKIRNKEFPWGEEDLLDYHGKHEHEHEKH